ncbi:hypothetical protein KM043_000767 [Ampulex compressa]|nr:hypothetical protein KM043_000767 [Ampulex compressa]
MQEYLVEKREGPVISGKTSSRLSVLFDDRQSSRWKFGVVSGSTTAACNAFSGKMRREEDGPRNLEGRPLCQRPKKKRKAKWRPKIPGTGWLWARNVPTFRSSLRRSCDWILDDKPPWGVGWADRSGEGKGTIGTAGRR